MVSIDGRPVIPEVRTKYAHIQTPDFLIDGDLEAAYKYLEDLFSQKIENKSGPIRPYSAQELDEQSRKQTKKFLDDLPPTITG